MIEAQILIPVADNSGQPYPDDVHAVFETELLRFFGGSSCLPGLVNGQWADAAGIVYHDQSRVYVVALLSIADGGKLRDAAEFAKAHYGQLNIYVRYFGLSEIF